MINSLDHCYQRGYSEASQGLTRKDNPYASEWHWNPAQRKAWETGFEDHLKDKGSMHRTTPKEERLLASLKTAIAAFDISLVREIEAIVAEELDHRRNEVHSRD